MRVTGFAMIVASAAVLGGCSMITVVPEAAVTVVQSVGDVFRDPRTQEEQTWDEIIAHTQTARIGSDRLSIEARGGALAGGGTVDLRLLVRASSETLTQGYTHFAIVHVRDLNQPIAGRLFGTPIYGSETVWIGSYEAFVASRYERDYGAAPRAWTRPGVAAVVHMMNTDTRRSSRAFNAREVYDSLIVQSDF
jgi:hypothetical protein